MAEEKEENPTPVNEFFYTWRIENVNLSWHKTSEELQSPTFDVDWLPKCSFSLKLFPKGTEGNEGFLSYFLKFPKDQVSMINKEFKIDFYLLAVDGSKVEPDSSEGFHSMKKRGMVGCPRFMRWKKLMYRKSDYLPGDILTVCCRIWIEINLTPKADESTEVKSCAHRFARTQIKKEVIAKLMAIDNIDPEVQKVGEIKSILQKYPIATFHASFGKISSHKKLTIKIDVNKINTIKMAVFELMLIDEKRERIFWMNTFSWNDFTEIGTVVLSSHFPQNSDQYVSQKMFDEKFLFLACQFTFTTGIVEQKGEKDDYGSNLKKLLPLYFPSLEEQTVKCPTLEDALYSMRRDRTSCDVEVINKLTVFDAHKIVLCSRSFKFQTSLQIQGNTSVDIIEVEDIDDSGIFLSMMKFLYSGKILEIDWKIAVDLYSAAMKFEIDFLKKKCCNFINANLDQSNVVEVLLLAKEHSDIDMITSARNFIMENRQEVYSSVEWDNFRKSYPDYAAQIMLPKFQTNYLFRV